ncbi:hypothetical protein [Solimonas terrae]|uniref:Uncharacterized protein n=1 Tax=Solimonas terrae TaxID=1396819 RepID=A0A6M2BXP5_9GAMM|nr:hypothetical protein [Solimonas terrae]NGY06903.1 hypothetical protein [Solimonas terrae]
MSLLTMRHDDFLDLPVLNAASPSGGAASARAVRNAMGAGSTRQPPTARGPAAGKRAEGRVEARPALRPAGTVEPGAVSDTDVFDDPGAHRRACGDPAMTRRRFLAGPKTLAPNASGAGRCSRLSITASGCGGALS